MDAHPERATFGDAGEADFQAPLAGDGSGATAIRHLKVGTATGSGAECWSRAVIGLHLIASDRIGIRALRLVAGSGPVRDAWLSTFRAGAAGPVVDAPSHVDVEALRGGIDVEATLSAVRPVRFAGLVERARGGTLVLREAERLGRETVAEIAAALDRGEIRVVALDSGDDEGLPAPLADRMTITTDLRAISWRDATSGAVPRLPETGAPVADDVLGALDAVARALPGRSLRRTASLASLFAALAGPGADAGETMAEAVGLHLGVRIAPPGELEAAPEPQADAPEPEPDSASATSEGKAPAEPDREDGSLEPDRKDGSPELNRDDDRKAPAGRETPQEIAAVLVASLSPGLLDGTGNGSGVEGRGAGAASFGARGRHVGEGRRAPCPGARPAILPTLRAAIPWQRARGGGVGRPIAVRPSDLRYARRVRPAGTTIVFAVDASGSAARERLAEAKGAVEALLAEAYVRRDKVALVAFRGGRADLLLAPTRGLVTARRALGALPGGGATPLAAGLLGASEVCRTARAAGERALLVVLTDGRGNVALNGTTGRLASRDDEEAAALAIRRAGLEAILIDTAARPGRHAPALAERMGARLLTMPRAKGEAWAAAVSEHLAP